MRPPETRPATPLLREVLSFQLKLLLEALRDVVLSPVALAAAMLDFIMMSRQPPRYFRAMRALGRRSDDWIDLWETADDAVGARPETVDAVLSQIETVVRDPRAGAHRARVLMRWAESQMARQRRRSGLATPLPPIGPPSPPPPPPL